jgi:hypothetical protein
MKLTPRQYFLLLLSLLVSSQAFSERQCGVPPRNDMQYDSMPSESNGPEPRVARISKQNNREVIWVTYSYPAPNGRDDVTRAVRSQNGGRTWRLDPKYRDTGFLNPEKAAVVYKEGENTLLSKSLDGGAHWTDCQFNVDGLSAQQLVSKVAHNDRAALGFTLSAIHPHDPATIYGIFKVGKIPSKTYPGTYEKVIDLPGVYVSHDAGDHWFIFAPNLSGTNPNERTQLGIDPSDPKRMIGHGKSGLVMTTDGGKSWSPVGQQADLEAPAELKGRREELARRPDGASIPPYPEFTYLALLQVEFQRGNSNVIYLVTNKGLYKTEDSARTWRLIYAGAPSYYELNSLWIDRENPSRLFLGTRKKVLISEDAGCHFKTLFDWDRLVRNHSSLLSNNGVTGDPAKIR